MKVFDIYASLFVEFAVGVFLGATLNMIMQPIVPVEVSRPILVGIFLCSWSLLSCILGGVGWKNELNRLAMFQLFLIGWLFFAAGLVGLGINEFLSLGFAAIPAAVTFEIGQTKVESKWVMRLVIIRRYRTVVSEEAQDDKKETWEN